MSNGCWNFRISGLVSWGVNGVAIEHFYFGGKRTETWGGEGGGGREGVSGRKQGSVCVCSHSTRLTYDSALCVRPSSAMI